MKRNVFTAICGTLLVLLAGNAAGAYSIPAEQVDEQQIYYGNAANFEKPATVDYTAIVKATPTPANWIAVRFEDFVNQQEATLARLEAYLGIPLGRIIVRRETVGRYDRAQGVSYFDFLEEGMREFGYEIPE